MGTEGTRTSDTGLPNASRATHGACSSATPSPPVALEEAPTRSPSRVASPRTPWRALAAASVKMRRSAAQQTPLDGTRSRPWATESRLDLRRCIPSQGVGTLLSQAQRRVVSGQAGLSTPPATTHSQPAGAHRYPRPQPPRRTVFVRARRVGGAFLGLCGALAIMALTASPASATPVHAFTASFGGEGEHALSSPAGVAVSQSSEGHVYVADKGNNRVEVFDSTGHYLSQFNGEATPAKSFLEPSWIAIDNTAGPSKGDVYVVDTGHDVIDKFTAAGTYVSTIEPAAGAVVGGVAIDANGNVWAANENGAGAGAIGALEFTESGSEVTSWANTEFGPSPGIAIDSEHNVFRARGNLLVAKFSSTGVALAAEATSCECTTALAVDAVTNNLYVDQGASVAEYGPFVEPVVKAPPIEEFGSGRLTSGSGVAVNSTNGTVYVADSANNDVDIFPEGEPPAAPETEAATGVTGESAELHGTLTSGSEKVHFSFSYAKGSSCSGPGATTTTAGEAESNSPESAVVTGLQPSAEYTFCLDAANAFGTRHGSERSLKTEGLPPVLGGEGQSAVTQTGATLEAQVDPKNEETSYVFEYATSRTGETLNPPVVSVPLPAGELAPGLFGNQPISAATGALTANTTYYFRVVAKSATPPEAAGVIQSFTTLPALPSAVSEAASKITQTTATIAGVVNPNNVVNPNASGPDDTRYYFQYGTTSGYGLYGPAPPPGEDAGTGVSPVSKEAALSGLEANTEYHYRLVAVNDEGKGIVTGADQKLVTLALPPESLGPATLTPSGAVLAMTANRATGSSYIVEYGTETGVLPATAPIPPGEAAPGTPEVLTTTLEGLTPNTTYHYRLAATNGFASAHGSEGEFTTPEAPAGTVEPPAGFSLTTGVSGATPTPPLFPSLAGIAPIPPPPVTAPKTITTKPLTRLQKLARALKACAKQPKRRRASCRARAKRLYATTSKKAKR
jgi:hypothetical protein